MDSLCHPWFTTTNLSYRFPIFETSATALCGTTGRNYSNCSSCSAVDWNFLLRRNRPIADFSRSHVMLMLHGTWFTCDLCALYVAHCCTICQSSGPPGRTWASPGGPWSLEPRQMNTGYILVRPVASHGVQYILISISKYYRRKFRSQTSNNTDKFKNRGGKSQRRDETRREEQKKEDQRREESEERRCRRAKR